MYNNTMISFNMLEVARIAGVKRFFYASSACIYPEYKQLDVEVEGGGLKEGDAWPAQPQDAYGLEKLVTEELCMHYAKDYGMATRLARFHNIYGPHGTWKGGREKAPAAFCRKVLTSAEHIEMWGDGKQTRRFVVCGLLRRVVCGGGLFLSRARRAAGALCAVCVCVGASTNAHTQQTQTLNTNPQTPPKTQT